MKTLTACVYQMISLRDVLFMCCKSVCDRIATLSTQLEMLQSVNLCVVSIVCKRVAIHRADHVSGAGEQKIAGALSGTDLEAAERRAG